MSFVILQCKKQATSGRSSVNVTTMQRWLDRIIKIWRISNYIYMSRKKKHLKVWLQYTTMANRWLLCSLLSLNNDFWHLCKGCGKILGRSTSTIALFLSIMLSCNSIISEYCWSFKGLIFLSFKKQSYFHFPNRHSNIPCTRFADIHDVVWCNEYDKQKY